MSGPGARCCVLAPRLILNASSMAGFFLTSSSSQTHRAAIKAKCWAFFQSVGRIGFISTADVPRGPARLRKKSLTSPLAGEVAEVADNLQVVINSRSCLPDQKTKLLFAQLKFILKNEM